MSLSDVSPNCPGPAVNGTLVQGLDLRDNIPGPARDAQPR